MKGLGAIAACLRAAFLPPPDSLPKPPQSRSFSEAVDRLNTEAGGLTRALVKHREAASPEDVIRIMVERLR